ncbi:uncharacterized protein LOC127263286 [Andrographis paniculata]|uniref:uncharacterized protein LOC127263286 n=1 Tax=Andrographis paniculata TaxID=175694 RepID=UPI0021E8D7E2|nr:uncharacterized protein LOC127263286 [Andrographis paniculata]
MKIGVWNIRGIHQTPKQIELVKLIKDLSIHLFGVLETKCNDTYFADFVRRRLPSWEFTHNFSRVKGGRIGIFWDPVFITVDTLEIEEQCISLRVACKVTSSIVVVTVVYGFNSLVKRRTLWDSLLRIGSAINEPWMVLGDFNSVLSAADRVRGRVVRPYDYKDFLSCVTALGLTDLPSAGCRYTWSNNNIWAKLDRVMVNHGWLAANFWSSVNFLAPSLSDHSPAVASIFAEPMVKRASFKFFNMWTSHPSFSDIVRAAWNIAVEGTAQFKLVTKLKHLKKDLITLNKAHFSHILERAQAASDALKQAQIESDAAPGLFSSDYLSGLRNTAVLLQQAAASFVAQNKSAVFSRE